jgi:hypothetical protein
VGDAGVARLHAVCMTAIERCAVEEGEGIAHDTFGKRDGFLCESELQSIDRIGAEV